MTFDYSIPFCCIAMHCLASHCIALHRILSHCIALHRLALHCIGLHRITSHCIASHCIVTVIGSTIKVWFCSWQLSLLCINGWLWCKSKNHWSSQTLTCSVQVIALTKQTFVSLTSRLRRGWVVRVNRPLWSLRRWRPQVGDGWPRHLDFCLLLRLRYPKGNKKQCYN